MTKQDLIDILTEAHEVGAKYIAIKVDMRGFDYPEIIVNYKGNILAKLDYYKRAYNDDLTLCNFDGIKITGVTYGNSYEKIESDLLFWKEDLYK